MLYSMTCTVSLFVSLSFHHSCYLSFLSLTHTHSSLSLSLIHSLTHSLIHTHTHNLISLSHTYTHTTFSLSFSLSLSLSLSLIFSILLSFYPQSHSLPLSLSIIPSMMFECNVHYLQSLQQLQSFRRALPFS